MNYLGVCIDISFKDSTPLKVCHYNREKQHKVFKNIAIKSQGTMEWYFSFKFYLSLMTKEKLFGKIYLKDFL